MYEKDWEEKQLDWDIRFLELAKHIATWSKDPSTKVGAVIVDDYHIVVGMGYNGFARGVDDDPARYADRDLKYQLVVHAELNAILQAGKKAYGSTLYVYPSFAEPYCCHECAKAIIQAGIACVIGYEPTAANAERAKRWETSLNNAKTMLDEAGVEYRSIPYNTGGASIEVRIV